MPFAKRRLRHSQTICGAKSKKHFLTHFAHQINSKTHETLQEGQKYVAKASPKVSDHSEIAWRRYLRNTTFLEHRLTVRGANPRKMHNPFGAFGGLAKLWYGGEIWVENMWKNFRLKFRKNLSWIGGEITTLKKITKMPQSEKFLHHSSVML